MGSSDICQNPAISSIVEITEGLLAQVVSFEGIFYQRRAADSL